MARPRPKWPALARRGGYPTPALEIERNQDRAVWFEGYQRTYLERDLQQLSAIDNLASFQRLARAAALRVGGLQNQADIARDVGLPPSTAQRYLDLRETRACRPELLFRRRGRGVEVDFVIETPSRLVPIKVKSASAVQVSDARHLEGFLDGYADRAAQGVLLQGVLLHGGSEIFPLTERVVAIPWSWMI